MFNLFRKKKHEAKVKAYRDLVKHEIEVHYTSYNEEKEEYEAKKHVAVIPCSIEACSVEQYFKLLAVTQNKELTSDQYDIKMLCAWLDLDEEIVKEYVDLSQLNDIQELTMWFPKSLLKLEEQTVPSYVNILGIAIDVQQAGKKLPVGTLGNLQALGSQVYSGKVIDYLYNSLTYPEITGTGFNTGKMIRVEPEKEAREEINKLHPLVAHALVTFFLRKHRNLPNSGILTTFGGILKRILIQRVISKSLAF